ncbi:hypothetical protein GCM10010342_77490 [Streptomyces anulatus]|nr:hypothetical protein GCM10010342_77490 [Streptomyces anulatus]
MDEHGLAVDGAGGIGPVTQSMLAAVLCVVSDADWLTLDQQARLLAVASAVTGAGRVLAQDPGGAITHGLPARMCAVLDHAARPEGPAGHRLSSSPHRPDRAQAEAVSRQLQELSTKPGWRPVFSWSRVLTFAAHARSPGTCGTSNPSRTPTAWSTR